MSPAPKRRSRIFSERELEALLGRLKGDPMDRQGVWYHRARPKVEEILYWAKRVKTLKKALKPRKRQRAKK